MTKLNSLHIAPARGGRICYRPRRGINAAEPHDAQPRTRGRTPGIRSTPSASAKRLLALLDRPRRAPELVALLNVSHQRVHQLLIVLTRLDLIRAADPERPNSVVARKDDPSLLLRKSQERTLSAFPETRGTTVSRIAARTGMPAATVATAMEFLGEAALVSKTGSSPCGDLYHLTAAGSAHWQRSATARRAEMPKPPFRSGRIYDVLTYLECQGPKRTRDVAADLALSPTSTNALMQYLKSKNAICNRPEVPWSPYVLTDAGRRMLMTVREMRSL